MMKRVSALMLASLVAASCASPPMGSVSATGSLSLTLAGLFPAEPRVQYLQAGKRAKVTVSGPGIAQALTVTAAIDGTSEVANLSGIPAGPNRVIELEAQDEAGEAIPGGRFRTTATLQEGANTAVLSPATTPRGDVFAKLLADGSALAGSLDASRVQEKIDAIQRNRRTGHFGLINGEAIAGALMANGGNLDALSENDAAFVHAPARLTVTVTGLPSNLPAEVWLDDPVSPKQSGVGNGGLLISPIKPGNWKLYGRAGSLRVGPVSLDLTSAPSTPYVLNFAEGSTLTTMSQPRGGAASGVLTVKGLGESLVMAGGQVTFPSLMSATLAATDSVVALRGGTWTTLAPMPLPVAHAGYAQHGNKLYVVGGRNPVNAVVSDVQVYDAAQDTWDVSLPALPTGRLLASAAIIDGYLYVAGGRPDLGHSTWLSRLPLSGDGPTWEDVSPLADPNRMRVTLGAATAVVDRKHLIISGVYMAGPSLLPTHEVLLYDPVKNVLRSVAPIPTARFGASTWIENGKVYVAGGVTALGLGLPNVEVYDPLTDTWSARPTLRSARGFAAFGKLDGKAVYAGGHDGSPFAGVSPFDDLESFAF